MSAFINKIYYKNVAINILRLDVLQPEIQGNKYYKLKYNLIEAQEKEFKTLLTFGGEYSNHIHATALAGLQYNLKTIGIIRGDKPLKPTSTIQDVIDSKMQVFYLNRTAYRIARKLANNNDKKALFELLKENFIILNASEIYLIPEGGTNTLALKGTSEILNHAKEIDYNLVCSAIGTAGTFTGIVASLPKGKRALGFPALKGNFFEKDITRLLLEFKNKAFNNWSLNHNYHFKGFGAFNNSLIEFINYFYKEYKIPLCTLYTGKMFYGIFDMIDQGELSNKDKILAIHTGGLQGRKAFNEKNGDLLVLD